MLNKKNDQTVVVFDHDSLRAVFPELNDVPAIAIVPLVHVVIDSFAKEVLKDENLIGATAVRCDDNNDEKKREVIELVIDGKLIGCSYAPENIGKATRVESQIGGATIETMVYPFHLKCSASFTPPIPAPLVTVPDVVYRQIDQRIAEFASFVRSIGQWKELAIAAMLEEDDNPSFLHPDVRQFYGL